MRTLTICTVIGALLASTPAGAFDYNAVYQVPARPSIVTNPKLVTAPDAKAAKSAYPRRALAARVNGAALLTCNVAADQHLTDCVVSWENPLDYGFGDAALSLAPLFRFEPATRDGRVIRGRPAYAAITFNLFPQSPPPTPAPRPAFPEMFAERGSYRPAPAELQEVQLLDGPLAAIARYATGFVLFANLADIRKRDEIIETSLINIFAYPGVDARPAFDVKRVRADCSQQTVAWLGERSFDWRGQPDGWRISDDEAPVSAASDVLVRRILDTLCLGPSSSVKVDGIDAAVTLAKEWPGTPG